MRTLTPRIPRPRLPKLALPVALVRTAEDERSGRAERPGRASGRGLARLTVIPALAIIAWLVPGLPLLLAGEFGPVPMVLIAAPLGTALAVNLLHRIPGRWPTDLPGPGRDRRWFGWFGGIGTVAVAAGFVLWQLAANSPSVIATRTPGVYFQTGFWIAQHGSLPIPANLAAFGGPHAGMHLSSIGFIAHGHFVVPAVTAGLPMLLAGGFWTSGTGGGAVIGPVLGGLAVLSFGGLVGRLAGRQWAPAGALVLALTLPELYTSRDAFSETAVQVLLFGGLSLVIDALTSGRPAAAATKPVCLTRPVSLSKVSAAVPAGAEPPAPTAVASAGAEPPAPTRVIAGFVRTAPGTADPAGPDRARDPQRAGQPARTGQAQRTGEPQQTGQAGQTDQPEQADETAELAAIPAAQPATGTGPAGIGGRLAALPGRLTSWLRTVNWRELPAGAAKSVTPEMMLAGLGGLAIGLTSLLSLASLVYLVPAIVVAGVLLVARRAGGLAFSIGLCAGVGYGIAAAYLLAQPPTGPEAVPLRVAALDAGGVILLTIAALLLMRLPRVRRAVRGALARRPLRWLPELGSVAVVAGLAWLAARPYLQTVRGTLVRGHSDYVATLQRLAGLKVDPARLYSEDTLYWVIWYAGIATVLLGGFAAAILLRRCLRALLTWRDTSGTGLNWALPLAIILGGSAAVLWQPFTVPDQPWASRRLVPVVLPGLILLAAWGAAWLTRRARDRGAGTMTTTLVGAFCVGAMLLPSVSTSFGFGLTHAGTRGGLRPTAGGLAQHSVGAHEADAVRGLCSAISGSSSVVILDRRIALEFSQVIRGMCGVPVAWVTPGAPPAVVEAILGGIARAGRHPVVLGSRPGQVGAFGGSPMLVMNLTTTQDPHELTQPPGAPWRARYVIWLASTGSPNAGV